MDAFGLPPMPGEGVSDPYEGDRLHLKKNRPDVPLGLQEWLDKQPPYTHQPFPTCVYFRHEGDDERVESRLALNDSQLQRFLDDGWVHEPTDEAFRAARYKVITKTGTLAAHRAFEDRNMSPAAQAIAERAELESEEHLVTVPEAPLEKKRGPGRPRKEDV